MRFFILIGAALLGWVLWASFSHGGLYQLKQINPEYPHPNNNVAYLTSKLEMDWSKPNSYWDKYHVEQCFPFMPNWAKAADCVKAGIYCQNTVAQDKDVSGNEVDFEMFSSEEFRSCWKNEIPMFGPIEWFRLSRGLWRGVISMGAIWLAGGFETSTVEEISSWEKENKRWMELMTTWVEKSQ